MRELRGLNGESLVLDDGWLVKLRASSERGRAPLDRYKGTDFSETSTRKFVLFGERSEQVQMIVDVGTFFSLMLPAERRAEAEEFVAAVEAARG